MHFPGTISLISALFVGGLTFLFLALGHYEQQDKEAYQRLMQGGEKDNSYVSTQNRLGLQKDFFWNNNGQTLRLHLTSETANLTCVNCEGKMEFVEQMHHVHSCVQEELFFLSPVEPMQRVLLMQADAASYYYGSHRLVANNVNTSRVIALGHDLKDPLELKQMLLEGTAQQVEFDGHNVILTGNVVVEHPLGKLEAQRIVSSSSEGRIQEFDKWKFSDQVVMEFKKAGQVNCGQATIDLVALSGNFLGHDELDEVTYKESLCNNRGEKHPLEVKSRRMGIGLSKNRPKAVEQSSALFVKEVTADDNVLINYNQLFLASADHAIYKRYEGNQRTRDESFSGIVTLFSDDNKECHFSSYQGHKIVAPKMTFDTAERTVTFTKPRGVIYKKELLNENEISFSSDWLIWDQTQSVLTLHNEVEVSQAGMGTIKTINAQIFQDTESNKRALSAVHTQGYTVLTYVDSDTNLSHVLTCQGYIHVDHKKKEAKLYSVSKDEKFVAPDQQIFFQDSRGEIYADKVLVTYSEVNGRLMPEKLILAGNVRIFNQLATSNEDSTPVKQYVIADRVEFYPNSKEMLFKSLPGNRVLFLDQVNALEVSAPALKIIRDKATKKEALQGLGDVRFSFIEYELEQLRSKFSLAKPRRSTKESF